jgi:GDP-L-fucose synthase
MKPPGGIFVAGHNGLVGSALVRRLQRDGAADLLLRSSKELDLRDVAAVDAFFAAHRPAYVYLAAARVGGILANDSRPAEFLRDNLLIESAVIDAAYRHGAKKLLFLGSSCIYPKNAAQPMAEDALLTGALEPTNQWYAIAKIAGLKMTQAYRRQYDFDAISVMPTNLYGPGDNFSLSESHVIPALIRKFHEATVAGAPDVEIWGTGSPRREFLHVDDLADACVFLMGNYSAPEPINVGWGKDISVGELAAIVSRTVGFTGGLRFDPSKPDGTPRKLLDVTRMTARGWTAAISLEAGIRSTYDWYRSNLAHLRN